MRGDKIKPEKRDALAADPTWTRLQPLGDGRTRRCGTYYDGCGRQGVWQHSGPRGGGYTYCTLHAIRLRANGATGAPALTEMEKPA